MGTLGHTMPTRKPRTNITLDDDVNEVFQRLAELLNTPKATLMADFLQSMKPHAQEIIEAIELVEKNKSPSLVFAKMFAKAQLQMGESLNDVMQSVGDKND
jgi:hypothetical protein